jgi:hypothetical protein
MRLHALAATAAAVLLLTVAPAPVPAASEVALPPVDVAWDYQIGGPRPVPDGVGIVVRDRSASPAGDYAVCYVNAFQTQPGEKKLWNSASHRDLVLRRADGKPVRDSEWGESLLDTSTATKRARLAGIVDRWVAGCAKAGYDAVEYDNLDSWTRSGKRLMRKHNVAYARLLTELAHARGLAAAQKNAVEIVDKGPGIGFDFAVVEDCARWRECAAYANAYDDRALMVEYTKTGFRTACDRIGDRVAVIRRDRDVTPDGTYATC